MPMPAFFRRKAVARGLPAGERIYAIGDIHGRLDLFHTLMARIADDIRARPEARVRCIVLGDFIDRGPQSRELIDILSSAASRDLIVLKGNHEAALVDAVRGDHDAAELWVRFGGLETLASFGAAVESIDVEDSGALIAAIRATIPAGVTRWLADLPLSHAAGGYFFVHAGVRPGVPIARQAESDMLWIREAFTDSDADHGAIIVHGHSICKSVEFAGNRIAVDTGAYRTGRLSAVALEGEESWAITTGA